MSEKLTQPTKPAPPTADNLLEADVDMIPHTQCPECDYEQTIAFDPALESYPKVLKCYFCDLRFKLNWGSA